MPSTAEYWDIDGVSLNEQTQNLRSWGGSREEPPPLRGSNTTIPYSYGDRWEEKVPGARQMILDGWMTGKEAELRTRWRAFRGLLWRPGEQFPITRRWKNEAGALMTATGLAEYVSGLEPIVTSGGTRFEFKVTLNMVDPFFYSDPVTVSFTAPGDKVVTIQGDHPTKYVQARFVGLQAGSRLEVRTGATLDNALDYASVPSGATALVDVEKYRATETLSGSTTPSSWKVSHEGRLEWLRLPKKTTVLRYSRTSGTGTASITYTPAWI